MAVTFAEMHLGAVACPHMRQAQTFGTVRFPQESHDKIIAAAEGFCRRVVGDDARVPGERDGHRIGGDY